MKALVVYRGNLPSRAEGWRSDRMQIGFVWEILTRLAARGVRLDVVCFGDPGQPRVEENGLIRIERTAFRRTPLGEIWTGAAAGLLGARALARGRYDLFHLVGEPLWHAGGVPAARTAGVPVLFTFLDPWYGLARSELRARRDGARRTVVSFVEVCILADLLERTVARMADRIVCVSDGLCRYLHRRGVPPEKTATIPNGVDTTLFTPRAPAAGDRPPTVAYLGSLNAMHGIFRLAEAFPRVLARVPGARLLFVGDGADRPALEEAVRRNGIGGRTTITGRVPYPEVPRHMAAADVGFIGWENETLNAVACPLKVVEYWAMGIPVVGRVGGEAKKGIDAGAGVHVEDLRPEPLADALGRVLSDRPRMESMGRTARDYAVNVHDFEAIADRYAAAYRSLGGRG